MAARFWVGGTGNWDASTTTHWSTTSGGSGGAAVPTSSDDVTFDSNSGTAATVAITAAASASTVTINKSDLTLALSAGLTTSGLVTLTTGTLNTNGQTCSWGRFNSSGTGTRTLSLGASAITMTVTNSTGTWDTTTTTNMTFNPGTSTITFAGSDTSAGVQTANMGSLTYNNVTFSVTGTNQLVALNGSSPTFANLTYTISNSNSNTVLTLGTNITVTSALNLSGFNANVGRLFVNTVTVGTPQTITSNGTNTLSNIDFQDIVGAGSASWNLNAITGGSGDCGGNSGITFTTGRNLFWVGGTGNWGAANKWALSSGGTANQSNPLAQDNLTFDASSFNTTGLTATINIPRAGKNIDFTNVTNSPTLASSYGAATLTRIYGNLTLVSGMTCSSTGTFQFEGRGSSTLTTANLSFASGLKVNAPGGTLTVAGNYLTGTSVNVSCSAGTLTVTSGNVTCQAVQLSANSSPAVAKTLNMGSGTWTCTGTGFVWNAATAVGLTVNAGTSTIVISDTSATSKTFGGNSLIYNNVTFSGDNITVQSSNTFNSVAINNAGLPNGLKMNAVSTQTVNGNITTNGSAGNLAILTTTSSTANLIKSSGTVSVDYMNITGSHASGGAAFYAGAHSTSGGSNTGWVFAAPPVWAGGWGIPIQ